VVKFVEAGKNNDRPNAEAKGVEDLSCCIDPYLDNDTQIHIDLECRSAIYEKRKH